MVSTFLLSTAVTGVLLLGVALFIRGLRKRQDKPADPGSGFDALGAAMKSPKAWTAGHDSRSLALAILAFVAVGTYSAVRGSGRSSAQAAGMGGFAVGLALLVAIAVKLVVA